MSDPAGLSKIKTRHAYIFLIIISIMMASSSLATAAELVIISSTGNDFKAGQVVDSSTDITLAERATLTLISQDGTVIKLQGPHSGPVQVDDSTAKSAGLISSLKKIITGKNTEAGSLGVVRSAGGPEFPADPWAIIATRNGKYCISLSKPVVLWRPDSRKTRKLILKNTGNGSEVKTVWHAGRNTLYWPRLLPLVDGATYRVDLSGERQLPKLTIIMVPDLPTPAHAAAWMADHGCEKQALRLIGAIK